MEIKRNRTLVSVNLLENGEVFELNGNYYIKSNNGTAVNITNGQICIVDSTPVRRVKGCFVEE